MKVNHKQNRHPHNGPGSYEMWYVVPTPNSYRSEDFLTTAVYKHCSIHETMQIVTSVYYCNFMCGNDKFSQWSNPYKTY